jgi:dTDP-glucose 4,6-dehydratase
MQFKTAALPAWTCENRAPMSGVYAGCVKPLASEDLEHILTHTVPLWDGVRGRHIFLSGGTGFFGAWLLESLACCNQKLNLELSCTVLSRDPEAFAGRMPHLASDSSIHFLKGDVRNFAFPDRDFDFVIHAAVPTTAEAGRQPLELLSTQLGGVEHMLRFAKARGVRKFLFISSGAVYGPQPEHLSHIPEDYLGGPNWLDPNAAYAEGKRVSEQMCSVYARESAIEFIIARCFAFVGPHLPLDQHFAIGNFIAGALAGRNISIRGDGTPMRSYLYAADLAIWLWTLLLRGTNAGSNPQVFNVGSGRAISIRDLAQTVIDELNPALKLEIAQQPIAGAPLLQYVPDVRKAEAMLGLRQTIGLPEAIRRTAAWHG